MNAGSTGRFSRRHTKESLGNRRCDAARAAIRATLHQFAPGPKGLNIKMSFGNNSSAPATAAIMATTVNTPKYRLGVKFDSVSMAKPTTTVSVV